VAAFFISRILRVIRLNLVKYNTPKTDGALRQFSQQLQAWSEEKLQQKPGPFRQSELCRGLIGAETLPTPPLVYWVNRESLLAGGIVILPDHDGTEILPVAARAALALGLPHFFTWGRREIQCWSATYSPPEKVWEYALPHGEESTPATFRKCFNLLIEELEKQFYNLQQHIPEISATYLANLIHITYLDILPSIQKDAQLSIAEGRMTPSPDALKNSLLQMLLLPPALATVNDLPRDFSVADFPNNLAEAVNNLPEKLKTTFTSHHETVLFPEDCQRRFLHYYYRLEQIKSALPEFIADAAALVLKSLSFELGGRPLPTTGSGLPLVAINPDSAIEDPSPEYEISLPGIAAAIALVRNFSNSPPHQATQVYTNPFDLKTKLANHFFTGALTDETIPNAALQKELNARLRFAWPNHKISFGGKTPVWAWQLLHLTGLLDQGSRLELTIPKNWLWDRFGEKIPEVIRAKFVISEIALIGENSLKCQFQPGDAATTSITRENDSQRTIEPPLPRWLRPFAIIALFASDPTFHLLETGELQFYEEGTCQGYPSAGLQCYLQSTLGKNLWSLLAPGRPQPRPEKMAAQIASAGVPLPNEKIIRALGQLSTRKGIVTTADIDQEITVWLGATTPIEPKRSLKSTSKKQPDAPEIIRLFNNKCLEEEIPIFPDNYIFKTPENQRIEYNFNGRLRIKETFFDEIILVDQMNNEITLQGIRQAEALELISTCRSGPIKLPRDQSETEKMLTRYVDDLTNLRKSYYRHATNILPDQEVTDKVNAFWRKQQLPDWRLVKTRIPKNF